MKALLVLSIVMSTVVGTWVGLRLLSLARRTRKLPEFAVGSSLFVYAAVSQPGMIAAQLIGREEFGLWMALTIARISAYLVAVLGLAVFTWSVFGRGSRWRELLMGAIAACSVVFAAGLIASAWSAHASGTEAPVFSRVALNACFVVAFLWMAAESLLYYGRLRRRLKLGLADPIVSNRMLIWGAGAAVTSACSVFVLLLGISGRGVAVNNPVAMAVITLAGLVSTVVWWLSFTPPRSYLEWIESRVSPGRSAHG